MQRHVLSGGRYPVLRALAILYVIGGAVTVLATLVSICFIYAKAPGTVVDRTIMSIGAIVAGFFLVISMLAIAELLKLAIDVEHNTRMNGLARTAIVGAGPSDVAIVGSGDGLGGRLSTIDDETAEAALIRGH